MRKPRDEVIQEHGSEKRDRTHTLVLYLGPVRVVFHLTFLVEQAIVRWVLGEKNESENFEVEPKHVYTKGG